MITLIADEKMLLSDLRRFVEPVEIHDANGKLIGLFVPGNLERGKEIYAKATARVDRSELARTRDNKAVGSTWEQIQGRLGLLEQEMQRRRATGEKNLTTEEALAYYSSLRENGQAARPSSEWGTGLAEHDSCVSP